MDFFVSISPQLMDVLQADYFSFFEDSDSVAHLLHFTENVRRKQDGNTFIVFLSKYINSLETVSVKRTVSEF